MKSVGVFEGKTRFSALIADAQRGEVTVITRNGKPVAEVGPVKSEAQYRARQAAENLKALRARLAGEGKLRGLNMRELIYEGRK